MEQSDEAGIQIYDAEEFLRQYPVWKKRTKALRKRIEQARAFCDTALIEQYVLCRSPMDGLPHPVGIRRSKTENLALALDELRHKSRAEQEEALRTWRIELGVLEMHIALYELAIESLTQQERMLISMHFHKGYSLRSLATGEAPSDYQILNAASIYSLRQMKQRILCKVATILAS